MAFRRREIRRPKRGTRTSRSPALAALLATAFLGVIAACSSSSGGGWGSGTSTGDHVPAAYTPSGHAAAGDTFVHLFEWRWKDIGQECAWLGAAGYKAVQVSPPNEHALVFDRMWPWWQRYQPVSYQLVSRSGDPTEFAAMVDACRAAGVDIYVDAVVNHMTATSSNAVGSAGSSYGPYRYPDYGQDDFHVPCAISSYQDAQQVRTCQLLGLQDLDTGSARVRQRIADYLVALHRLGVAGFRIDAAKHISSDDLDVILNLVNSTAVTELRPVPYFFLEVIDYGGEAVKASFYDGVGYSSGGVADITEFKATGVFDKFSHLGGTQWPADLAIFPAGWGLQPADKAVVFVTNHDTERSGGASYKAGNAYRLAYLYLLAQAYGYVSVMSGYAFTSADAGPASDGAGNTLPIYSAYDGTGTPSCKTGTWIAGGALSNGDWICQHRDPAVAAMVRFRTRVAGEPVAWLPALSPDVIAFGRGAKGFVAMNAGSSAFPVQTDTGLPAGTYCDLLTGGKAGAACAGTQVVVASAPGGSISLTLAAGQAIAIHVDDRLP